MIVDHSNIIIDMFFARLVTLPYFEGFVARRSPQLPVQPLHLPYLGVYFVDESAVPWGDGNQGPIAFRFDLRLGISVQMADNDTVIIQRKLGEAYWWIMHGLWEDQYLMNLLDTYNPTTGTRNPNNMRIESVERGHRRLNWGAPGLNNETPWAELQYEPVVRYRWIAEPGPFDDLHQIDIQAVPMRTHHTETTPWQEKTFLNEELRDWWIKDNYHRYEIEKLEDWIIRYRTVILIPPHVPSMDEVQRIIMRYEFGPDGAKPRPDKDAEPPRDEPVETLRPK